MKVRYLLVLAPLLLAVTGIPLAHHFGRNPGSVEPPVVRVTYIGTATMLLEIGHERPFRILTDPALDPAGKTYRFALGTSSRKTEGPALSPTEIGPVDLVLLSHDEHADNLDIEGRKFLSQARNVLTTPSGAGRLSSVDRLTRVVGLESWQSRTFETDEGWTLRVTAVPARHGQWFLSESLPFVGRLSGDSTGFVLQWAGQTQGSLYFSGDTVYFDELLGIPRRTGSPIAVALMNLGGVRFPQSGPLRYTLNGEEAAKLTKGMNLLSVVPMHFDGWTHFKESLNESLKAFERADLLGRIRLVPRGQKVVLKGF